MKYVYLIDINSGPVDAYFIRCDAAKIREGLSMHSQVPKARVKAYGASTPPRWAAGSDIFAQYSEDDFEAGLIPGVRRNKPFYCFSDAPKRVKVMQFKDLHP